MGEEIDINYFIPSFGDFIIYCHESDITLDKCLKITREFLDYPKKYGSSELIKEYLCDNLDIDSYISLINKLELE